MHNKAMTEFGEILRGTFIGRDHPDYEDARRLYNEMIDKRAAHDRPLRGRDRCDHGSELGPRQ